MGASRQKPWFKVFLAGVAVAVVLVACGAMAMHVTDQRPFCGACHVMDEAARTHKMSTHANLACNDCHTPRLLVEKMPFKAAEGTRDFVSTLQGKDIPLFISLRTKDVINANCKFCHAMTNMDVASMDVKPYCVDCHRSNAHMRQKPISTRMVANE